ncbi:twin-arginine translocation signal domain-containing protein [Cytobacillus purgationiresistens]|uniref:Secreted protein n=1 Tax=Cytobacillus purgationiresistens TaxID=863449 RepID=A0ABU0ALC7_9BACI|nr:twin-arginine translocation signal domain-containing protein [Cytobacillus purgationiresistens]MDQ0272065.1 hypothetical protein [Cytobacillus purgationiresistens]
MSEKKVSRRKFLGFLGAGVVTIAASSLPLKVFADETNPPPIEGDPNSLPLEPDQWGDTYLAEDAELPQDPNILLVDIDSLLQ